MMSIYFFGRAFEQQVALAGGQWPNDLGDRVVAFITGLVCLHTLGSVHGSSARARVLLASAVLRTAIE